jgi:alpha-tubulin suppressor-like RCC1 family protein
MSRPSRAAGKGGQGALSLLPLLLLPLAACPPWYGEDLAALADRVSYRTTAVGVVSCGLAESGGIYCWGLGGDVLGSVRPTEFCFQPSNVGNGHDEECSKRPVPVLSDERFVQLAVGATHSCAVTEEGEVHCWGGNSWGQMGFAPAEDNSVGAPKKIEGLPEIAMVALNGTQSCAVSGAGELWCWGAPGPVTAGGHGFPGPADHVPPFRVGSPASYVEVALADGYGCARTAEGEIDCWGEKLAAQIGLAGGPACVGDPDGVCLLPVRLGTGARFSKIVAGRGRTCGLAKDDGGVWCWGESRAPALEAPGSYLDLAVHGDHLCTVSGENLLSCSGGMNPVGADASGPKFRTVAVDYWNACGVALSGDVWCWGSNGVGELGDGTTTSSATPVRTSDPYAY